MQPKNLAIVDTLRALSAQAVLVGHFYALLAMPMPADGPGSGVGRRLWQAIEAASGYSHQAVIVFFLLSGYLVGGQVLREMGTGDFDYGNYMLRRLVRLYSVIAPGLVIGLLVVHLAFGWGHGWEVVQQNRPWYPAWFDSTHSNALSTLACNLAGLQMIACYQYGHNLALWSLSNELLYYVAFPSLLLVAHAARPSLRLLHLGVAAGVGVLMAAGNTSHDPDRTLIYFSGFLIWCAGAVVPWAYAQWARLPAALRWVVLLGFAASALAGYRSAQSIYIRDATVAVLAACALMAGQACPLRWERATGLMSFVASYSYSLYLIHLPLLLLVLSVLSWPHIKLESDLAGALLFAGACVTANSVAYLFYLPFERRYRDIARWVQGLLRLPAREAPR